MKRFLVFGYNSFYPQGGWDDLVGKADTKEEADKLVSDDVDNSWHQIVDLQEEKVTMIPYG